MSNPFSWSPGIMDGQGMQRRESVIDEQFDAALYDPPGREMTGFFATLTPEQKAAALAYRGEDTSPGGGTGG